VTDLRRLVFLFEERMRIVFAVSVDYERSASVAAKRVGNSVKSEIKGGLFVVAISLG
jgi:hypothetical protein